MRLNSRPLVTGACIDVDECTDPNICFQFSSCNNTFGSYECLCDEGFLMNNDGTVCNDIDECTVTPNICGGLGTCENTIGSYDCICDTGYEFDNVTCVDVDECRINDICQPNSNCTNTFGSYDCDCYEGFGEKTIRLNSFVRTTVCVDIDECLLGQDECDSKGSKIWF